MKKLLLVFILSSACSFAQNNKVEPFLPEVFKQFPNVRDISISTNNDEVYFSIQSYLSETSAIGFIEKKNNKWSKPQIVSFSGKFNDLEPFLSPNGLRLYYASNRPLNVKETKTKDYDIWFVERNSKNDAWSNPINLGAPINTSKNEFYPSISSNGNIYFTSDWDNSKGKDDIYFSEFKDKKHVAPQSLSENINSLGYEFNAYISPDEKTLIYSAYNRKNGIGSGDLYISVKNESNEWSKAKNLGAQVNSNKMDYCPYLDTKTNTLYFTSKRNSVLKSFKNKQTIDELLIEMNKYENGLSRIYKVQLNN